MRHPTQSPVTGGCQCGAVRYRASEMLDNAHLCHCRMCQKAVGNIFAALVAAPNHALEFTRGAPSLYRSSGNVERGFCNQCGTPLFYRDMNGNRTNLTIGSLDHAEAFAPKVQMGSESRVFWFASLAELDDEGPTGSNGEEGWAAAIAATSRQHPDHDTPHWPGSD